MANPYQQLLPLSRWRQTAQQKNEHELGEGGGKMVKVAWQQENESNKIVKHHWIFIKLTKLKEKSVSPIDGRNV